MPDFTPDETDDKVFGPMGPDEQPLPPWPNLEEKMTDYYGDQLEPVWECVWSYDDENDAWDTSCGSKFTLSYGTPTEHGMNYCCYCGQPLFVETANDKEKEDD